jgi:hypothetical protein
MADKWFNSLDTNSSLHSFQKTIKQGPWRIYSLIKVWTFWEGHKIWKNLPLKIWRNWVTQIESGRFLKNFVPFSERLNFNGLVTVMEFTHTFRHWVKSFLRKHFFYPEPTLFYETFLQYLIYNSYLRKYERISPHCVSDSAVK